MSGYVWKRFPPASDGVQTCRGARREAGVCRTGEGTGTPAAVPGSAPRPAPKAGSAAAQRSPSAPPMRQEPGKRANELRLLSVALWR